MDKNIRIVLADYNETCARNLEKYLIESTENIKVVGIATTGKDTLKLIKSREPDILLLDITMPDMDGTSIIEFVNELPKNRRPFVIAVSNINQKEIIEEVFKLGVKYYFIKPMDLKVLVEKIYKIREENFEFIENKYKNFKVKKGYSSLRIEEDLNEMIQKQNEEEKNEKLLLKRKQMEESLKNNSQTNIDKNEIEKNIARISIKDFDVVYRKVLLSEEKKKQLKDLLMEYMHRLYIPSHIKGYCFLQEAIVLVLKDGGFTQITKNVYPVIAKRHETSVSAVERAIRNAIETSWKRISNQGIKEVLGFEMHDYNKRPTNSEMLEILSDKIAYEIYFLNSTDNNLENLNDGNNKNK